MYSLGNHRDNANSARGRLGKFAEDYAAKYLLDLGWIILDRNWCGENGEIDIIGLDPDGVCVFVEVKSKRGLGYGPPLEAVTPEKIARIALNGYCWLKYNKIQSDHIRIDAIGILVNSTNDIELTHIKGISQ